VAVRFDEPSAQDPPFEVHHLGVLACQIGNIFNGTDR
jgi:hypothetical protein